MIRSPTRLHGHSSNDALSNWEITLPNDDQIYKFSGKCGKCNHFIYRHPAEAGAIWFLAGEMAKKYGGINQMCSTCFSEKDQICLQQTKV